MPGRITPLVTGQYYHIYNRGSEKRDIFTQSRDFSRFLKTLFYYQFIGSKVSFSKFSKFELNLIKPILSKKIVEIICYCLMPNHFHCLIHQLQENGISNFISHLSNSYTKYFNIKYDRVGPLFQGAFKAVLIESDEQLIHLSRYIHLNPVAAGLLTKPEHYRWSSYQEYITGEYLYCSSQIVMDQFPSKEKYREFVEAQIDYGITLEILKHKVLDKH